MSSISPLSEESLVLREGLFTGSGRVTDLHSSVAGQATPDLTPVAMARRRWLQLASVSVGAVLTGCGEKPAAKPSMTGAAGDREAINANGKWITAGAEEMGMDGNSLRTWSDWLGGNGCLVRRNRMVHSWGAATAGTRIWSASKAIYGYLLLRAIDQKRLAHLDQRVVEMEPRLASLNPEAGNKDATLTWRHLLHQVSGYGLEEAPGAAFAYNDYAMTMLWETMVYKVFRVPPGGENAMLEEQLGKPLQFQKPVSFGKADSPNFGLISIAMTDLARFGQLCLQDGLRHGSPVVEAAALRSLIHSPLPAGLPRTSGREKGMISGARTFGAGKDQDEHWGSYSHAWWVNGRNAAGQLLWPEVPEDAYGAFGHGGKFALVVMPGQQIAVAWARVRFEAPLPMAGAGRINLNEALGKLLKTIKA